jgi:hypothetical protein
MGNGLDNGPQTSAIVREMNAQKPLLLPLVNPLIPKGPGSAAIAAQKQVFVNHHHQNRVAY